MKKILVTQNSSRNEEYYEIRQSLDIEWYSFLKTVGVIPIPISYKTDIVEYFNNFDVGGILITGGNNLSNYSNCSLSRTRDDFELNLIDQSLMRNVPIVGVCRGMQIIAKFFDLEIGSIDNHVNNSHKIIFSEKSLFFNEYKKIKIVNSFHNFAIKSCNSKLAITSRSTDDSIESIEHKSHKVIGIMWHPERNDPFDKEDINLFKKILSS